MSELKIREWQAAKTAVKNAKYWHELPHGQSYASGDSFKISIAHCKAPMLMRAGQQTCGGQNYWETEATFNQAILEHLVEDWRNIYLKVIKILEEKERKALVACQEYVTEMQSLINRVTEEV